MARVGKYVNSEALFGTPSKAKPEMVSLNFINEHANVLVDLGGDLSKKEYVRILSQYKYDPIRFDREFTSMRAKIFKKFHY